ADHGNTVGGVILPLKQRVNSVGIDVNRFVANQVAFDLSAEQHPAGAATCGNHQILSDVFLISVRAQHEATACRTKLGVPGNVGGNDEVVHHAHAVNVPIILQV